MIANAWKDPTETQNANRPIDKYQLERPHIRHPLDAVLAEKDAE
jgi:hypothetical protein